nr:MAG TPA: hypothetical protein [Caudoviricetes sp.]
MIGFPGSIAGLRTRSFRVRSFVIPRKARFLPCGIDRAFDGDRAQTLKLYTYG